MPLDNNFWPPPAKNDLLPQDLTAFKHLIQHFNADPKRAAPPQQDLWAEKHDRGKTFRDLRDGSLDHRRREAYCESWGVSVDPLGVPQAHLDLSRQDVDHEGIQVLTTLLRDGHVDALQNLIIGKSKIWGSLDAVRSTESNSDSAQDGFSSPESLYSSAVRLADAMVIHPRLETLRLAAIDLPLRALRGFEKDTEVDLSNRGLRAMHGIIVASGLRKNQILRKLDLRFNAEGLGAVGIAALAEAFAGGAAAGLEELNVIKVDGQATVTLTGDVCKYELIWVARRMAHIDNYRRVRTLQLRAANIDPEMAAVVAGMVPSLHPKVELIDLSHNRLCGTHCDRFGTWHGVEDRKGLEVILRSLKGMDVGTLKLNGCALTAGVYSLARALADPRDRLCVRTLELRECNLELRGQAALLSALGGGQQCELADGSGMASAASFSSASAPHAYSSVRGASEDTPVLVGGAMSGASVASLMLSSPGHLNAPELAPSACTVRSLDLRGNRLSRAGEAELAALVEPVFECGVLEALNGIDFAPYARLRDAPTSSEAGEEWWKTGGAAKDAKEAKALGTREGPPANPRVAVETHSGRALHLAPSEAAASGEAKRGGAWSAPVGSLATAGEGVVTTLTTRGGLLFTCNQSQRNLPPMDLRARAKGEDALTDQEWVGGGQAPSSTLSAAATGSRFGGVGIHEVVFAVRQALRLRLTKLVAADTRLVGLSTAGEGLSGLGEAERLLSMEPLRAVASLLKDSAYLLKLDLGSNALGDVGVGAIAVLADSLAANCSLRSLSLRRNRLGPEHLDHLASALQHNAYLETLDLGDNCFGAYNAIRTFAEGGPAEPKMPRGIVEQQRSGDLGGGSLLSTGSGPSPVKGKKRLTRVGSKASTTTMEAPRSFGSSAASATTTVTSGGTVNTVRTHRYRGSRHLKVSQRSGFSVGSTTGSALQPESLGSSSRAVSGTLTRFMRTLVHANKTLLTLDLRDNGWTMDEMELFADALDAPRDPPFVSFSLS